MDQESVVLCFTTSVVVLLSFYLRSGPGQRRRRQKDSGIESKGSGDELGDGKTVYRQSKSRCQIIQGHHLQLPSQEDLPLAKVSKRRSARNVTVVLGSNSEGADMDIAEDPAAALKGQHVEMIHGLDRQIVAVTTSGDLYRGSPESMEFSHAFASLRTLHDLKVKAVACGKNYFAALTKDWDVYTWGSNEAGQLGHGTTESETYPRRVSALVHCRVKKIVCGPRHTLCITSKGEVYSWGEGKDGRLGHGCKESLYQPKRILSFEKWKKGNQGRFLEREFVDVACGRAHSLALDSYGEVFCFGETKSGQCTLPELHKQRGKVVRCTYQPGKDLVELLSTAVPNERPQLAELLMNCKLTCDERIINIFACENVSLALSDAGYLYSWGEGQHGELGRNCPVLSPLPGRINFVSSKASDDIKVVQVSCGCSHSVAVMRDGNVFGWGDSGNGELGVIGSFGEKIPSWKPRIIRTNQLAQISTSRCESMHDDFPSSNYSLSTRVACGDGFTIYIRNVEDEEDFSSLAEVAVIPEPRHPSEVEEVVEKDIKRLESLRKWETKFLPKWKEKMKSSSGRSLWYDGVPEFLRTVVWPKAIGNSLRITKAMYYAFKVQSRNRAMSNSSSFGRWVCDGAAAEFDSNSDEDHFLLRSTEWKVTESYSAIAQERETATRLIDSDLPRTFPQLGFFTPDGPLGARLRSILNAFAAYRPDLGYVQGMSYLAATLLLNIADEFLAFRSLANLIFEGHLFAFFQLDPDLINPFYAVFEIALKENSPTKDVAVYLEATGVHPALYAFNWFQTLFLKVLPLRVAFRVIDCFLIDGTSLVIKTAIAIIQIFRPRLLNQPFEDCIKLLTRSPGLEDIWFEEANEGLLFRAINSIKLSPTVEGMLEELSTFGYDE